MLKRQVWVVTKPVFLGILYKKFRNTLQKFKKYAKMIIQNLERMVYMSKSRIGEKTKANNGMEMVIVGYRSSSDIDVKFEDGTVVVGKRYQQFKKGEIANPNVKKKTLREDRVGSETTAKNGQKMKIVAYRSSYDIDVVFEDGTKVCGRSYSNFEKGRIRNPNKKR
jgi:hypothetical protein